MVCETTSPYRLSGNLLGSITILDSVWKMYNHIDSVWTFSPFNYLLCVCGIISRLSLRLTTSFPVFPFSSRLALRTSPVAFLIVSSISLVKIAMDAHDIYDVSLSAVILASGLFAFDPKPFALVLTGQLRLFERTRLRRALRRRYPYRKVTGHPASL